MSETKKLTAREQRLVLEIVSGAHKGNNTKAGIAAGFSPKSAKQNVHEVLKRPHVSAALDALRAQIAQKLELSAEGVLKRLQTLSIKAEGAGQFAAAVSAEKLLGQHLKLFTEKHEHGGIGGGPVQFTITPSEADH